MGGVAIALVLAASATAADRIGVSVVQTSPGVTVSPRVTTITTATTPTQVTVSQPQAGLTAAVLVPGPQGIPGTGGTGGGVSSWNDLTDKPAEFPPVAHTQGIDTVTGLQTALDGKASLGAEVDFSHVTIPDYGDIEVGSTPLYKTTISMSSVSTGQLSGTWLGLFNSTSKVHVSDVINGVNHTHMFGNPHNTEAYQITGLAAVATSGSYNDLSDKPTLLRGYDGREIELQTSATHIQWRYLGAADWNDLVPLASLTGAAGADGADGKNYTCAITGGIRSLQYDKDGLNPAPTMVAFGVELRENGVVVTPATYSWSVPASGSLLSGSSSSSTFTPTVSGTFTASSDNRVDVAVTYAGITCSATAPVPVTKVGADGAAGSPDTKQQIYTKISAATTGDVLNTEAGAGDAAGFAFRTVRATGGDIHRTDLAGGQSFIHARPSDASTAIKFGLKDSSGTVKTHIRADGCLVIQ